MSVLTYVAEKYECYSIVKFWSLGLKPRARLLELVKIPQILDRATFSMENILLYGRNSWNISIGNTKSWFRV